MLIDLGDPEVRPLSEKVKEQIKDRHPWVFDFSMLSTYLNCQTKYYLRHELGLTSTTSSSAAILMGSGLHNALALHYNELKSQPTGKFEFKEHEQLMQQGFVAQLEDDIRSGNFPLFSKDSHDGKRSVEKAFQIIHDYLEEYSYEPFSVVAVEEPFAITFPVRADDTKFDLIYVGRMDMVIKWRGKTYIVDHKTSSMMTDAYLESFRPNHQISGYIYAIRELTGKPINGALINVLGIYKNETRFARVTTERSEFELESFKTQMQEVTLEILRKRKLIEEGAYYEHLFRQNPQSCHKWNKMCQFGMICKKNSAKGRKIIMNAHYTKDVWVPYEIEAGSRFSDSLDVWGDDV